MESNAATPGSLIRLSVLSPVKRKSKPLHSKQSNEMVSKPAFPAQTPFIRLSASGAIKRKSKPAPSSNGPTSNSKIASPTKKMRLHRSVLATSNIKSHLQRGSPSVHFGHVDIREHSREMGGSCGMPETGAITLGLSNKYCDLGAVSVDKYEHKRAQTRGVLRKTPEKVKKKLLVSAMGAENFDKRLQQEQHAVATIRKWREDSIASDSRYLRTFNDRFGNQARIGIDPLLQDRPEPSRESNVSPPYSPSCSGGEYGAGNLSHSLLSGSLVSLPRSDNKWWSPASTSTFAPTCSLQSIGTAETASSLNITES